MQERFDALTDEQAAKLEAVRNEADMAAFLNEIGYLPSPEEKAKLAEYYAPKPEGELSDEELAKVSGGALWKKCPKGKYEYWFATAKCNGCTYFLREQWGSAKQQFSCTCNFFRCTKTASTGWSVLGS
jgi:bacteriocin-like protein